MAAPVTVEEKLAAKGLTLPPAVAPMFSYIPSVRTGNQLWLSGQIPRHADGKSTSMLCQRAMRSFASVLQPQACCSASSSSIDFRQENYLAHSSLTVDTGKLGGNVTIEEGQAAARVCILNGLAQVKAALGSLEEVARIIKVVVFVASKEGTMQYLAFVSVASFQAPVH